jgi:non-ribosomal peptide synthetase component F
MLLSCRLQKKGLLAHISFDSSVIGAAQVRRISRQFEHILRQVCEPENSTKTLAEMQMLSDSDLQDIWQWNAKVPQAAEVCIHDLFTSTARRRPYAPAVCAWDGELTYQPLDELSTQLARHLVQAGVGPEVIVPLCFEKSMWTPVTMLAVMKAGGASLAMDTTLPEERLRTMVKQAAGPVILSSVANEALARSLADDHATVFIPEILVQRPQTIVTKSLPVVSHPICFMWSSRLAAQARLRAPSSRTQTLVPLFDTNMPCWVL